MQYTHLGVDLGAEVELLLHALHAVLQIDALQRFRFELLARTHQLLLKVAQLAFHALKR